MKLIKTIQYLAEHIEKRIQNKFDLIIAVEGKRGMGKSTFLYVLGQKLNNRKLIKFNPKKHLTYSREDSLKVLANSKNCFLMNDEMINVAYNRDFWESEQKELIKALNNYRDSTNVFAMAIPKFIDLDKQMQRLCEMRVVILKRGLAQVHQQLRGVYRADAWDSKENAKLELKSKKGHAFGKLTTKVFYVKFPNLSEKKREFYEQLKHERRGRIFNKDVEEYDPNEKFYNNLLKLVTESKINQSELDRVCLVANKPIKTVRNMLNEKLRSNGFEERLQHFLNETDKKRQERVQKQKIKKKLVPVIQAPENLPPQSDTGNYNIISPSNQENGWDKL